MLTKVVFLYLHGYLCVGTNNNCNSYSKTGAFGEFLKEFKMAVLSRKLTNVVELFLQRQGGMCRYSRSARCIPIRLLATTFNNSNNLLELSFMHIK